MGKRGVFGTTVYEGVLHRTPVACKEIEKSNMQSVLGWTGLKENPNIVKFLDVHHVVDHNINSV